VFGLSAWERIPYAMHRRLKSDSVQPFLAILLPGLTFTGSCGLLASGLAALHCVARTGLGIVMFVVIVEISGFRVVLSTGFVLGSGCFVCGACSGICVRHGVFLNWLR
jgi:hypothetical protein